MKIKVSLILMLSTYLSFGQFNYQSIIKDVDGNIVKNSTIKLKFSIFYGTNSSTIIYSEQHNINVPEDGVINTSIGSGSIISSTVSFSQIDWSNQDVYLAKEVDLNDSGTFTSLGSSKFNSVPIAEYARNAKISTDKNSNIIIATELNNPEYTINDNTFQGQNIAMGLSALA